MPINSVHLNVPNSGTADPVSSVGCGVAPVFDNVPVKFKLVVVPVASIELLNVVNGAVAVKIGPVVTTFVVVGESIMTVGDWGVVVVVAAFGVGVVEPRALAQIDAPTLDATITCQCLGRLLYETELSYQLGRWRRNLLVSLWREQPAAVCLCRCMQCRSIGRNWRQVLADCPFAVLLRQRNWSDAAYCTYAYSASRQAAEINVCGLRRAQCSSEQQR
jgi:hypothetical protein